MSEREEFTDQQRKGLEETHRDIQEAEQLVERFNDEYAAALVALRKGQYGKLVDNELSNWLIDVIRDEKSLAARELAGEDPSVSVPPDSLLGENILSLMVQSMEWEGIDDLRDRVKANRAKMGERIGEHIRDGNDSAILALSRAIKSVSERIKEIQGSSPSPERVVFDFLKSDYLVEGKTTVTRGRIRSELERTGHKMTDRAFGGLLKRLDLIDKIKADPPKKRGPSAI